MKMFNQVFAYRIIKIDLKGECYVISNILELRSLKFVNNSYLRLRFSTVNLRDTYLRLKNCVVVVGRLLAY